MSSSTKKIKRNQIDPQRLKLLQQQGCVSCGIAPVYSKKLRPSSDGGMELFCKDCIAEGKAISQMPPEEREEYE